MSAATRTAALVASVEPWIFATAHTVATSYQVLPDLQDLKQEGVIAAFDAAGRFTSDKESRLGKNPFLTFAAPRIRGEMVSYAIRQQHAVRVPEKRFLAGARVDVCATDALEPWQVAELLGSAGSVDGCEPIEQRDRAAFIARQIDSLPARHAAVIRRRFYSEHVLREIAEDWDLTIEAIRSMEVAALRMLRSRLFPLAF